MVDVCGRRHTNHLYYDASCLLFQQCHLPYVFLSISFSINFIFIPTLLLLFYSCHKYCCCCCTRRLTLFEEIAKIFHQSFKDGTDGTRDYRWFAGIYLALRIIIVTSLLWRSSHQTHILSSVTGLLLVAVFQPHVSKVYNITDSLLFGGLTALFVLWPTAQSRHIAMILSYFIPLLVVVTRLCWKSKSYLFCNNYYRCAKYFHKYRNAEHNDNHFSQNFAKETKPLLQSQKVTQSVVDLKCCGGSV